MLKYLKSLYQDNQPLIASMFLSTAILGVATALIDIDEQPNPSDTADPSLTSNFNKVIKPSYDEYYLPEDQKPEILKGHFLPNKSHTTRLEDIDGIYEACPQLKAVELVTLQYTYGPHIHEDDEFDPKLNLNGRILHPEYQSDSEKQRYERRLNRIKNLELAESLGFGITSKGGSLKTTYDLINVLDSSVGDVSFVVYGDVASAAALLFTYANDRFLYAHSALENVGNMTLHEPRYSIYENFPSYSEKPIYLGNKFAQDFDAGSFGRADLESETLKLKRAHIENSRTGVDMACMDKIIDGYQDTEITASEAVMLGWADATIIRSQDIIIVRKETSNPNTPRMATQKFAQAYGLNAH